VWAADPFYNILKLAEAVEGKLDSPGFSVFFK
jgi:hypothetical protein